MPPDESLSGPRTAPAIADLPGTRLAERVQALSRNGPVLLLLSSAFIGAMAVAVKVACAHLPTGEVTFLRFFGGFLLFWPFVRARVVDVRARNRKLTYLRGILSGVAIASYFQAIDRIPVAHAVLMQNTYPMFIVLFSMALLKERAGLDTAACFAVAFTGVALMLERGLSAHGAPILGYAFGLISAIFAAGAVMATRTLRKTDTAVSIFYYFSLVGSLVSLPLALADFRAPDATAVLALALTIGLSVVGQLLLNQAFKYTGAAQGSVLLMASTVVAAALGALLLGDRYSANFFIGAALIFGAVGWLTARARVTAALPEHESEPPA